MPIMLPSNSRFKPVIDLEFKHPALVHPESAAGGDAGGEGGSVPPQPPPPPPPSLCCKPRPCDCACPPTHAVEVVREAGSITAEGGDAIVNVTAPVPGDYVKETIVEGGLVDRILPRTPNDWLKLAAGAVLGFLLGRKLR